MEVTGTIYRIMEKETIPLNNGSTMQKRHFILKVVEGDRASMKTL